MPAITKCCCCCGLKTGVLVLGWLGLISCVLTIISNVNALIFSHDNEKIMTTIDDEAPALNSYVNGSAVNGIALGTSLLNLFIEISLIYGAHKEKKIFIMPWLIWNVACMVLIALIFFIIGFGLFLTEKLAHIGVVIYLILFLLIGLWVYLWMCVLSLYKKYTEDEKLNKRTEHEEIEFIPSAPAYGFNLPPPYSLQNV